ncbi:MAG: phosphoribosylformylglycinamidine synthase subunit PurQ, partial [Bacteroidia bacterium]|nr:phosphoribosylformylglycinamidine synthase subunit PurQ [Bacteroidia bacterium]
TQHLPKDKSAYKIPIAHGEGNYYADKDTLQSLQDNEQIVFQYCDENGNVNEGANPNGSLMNIAGVCNKSKNVFGMMPHPERAADDELRNTDGLYIFQSIIENNLVSV